MFVSIMRYQYLFIMRLQCDFTPEFMLLKDINLVDNHHYRNGNVLLERNDNHGYILQLHYLGVVYTALYKTLINYIYNI